VTVILLANRSASERKLTGRIAAEIIMNFSLNIFLLLKFTEDFKLSQLFGY
jgi:hypothetical protein